jgi:hypothetical protein
MRERQWYYEKDGKQCGPISEAALIDLFHQRALEASTRVWTRGMEDWHEALTVNALAPAVLPPLRREPPLAPRSFGRERPTSVAVFGILNIVFGSLGLLCMAFGLIACFVWPDVMNSEDSDTPWTLLSGTVEFVSSMLLIVVGIGLLYLKRWARIWCLGYGWFAIVWGLISIVNSTWAIRSVASEYPQMAVAGGIGILCGTLVYLVYPVLLVIFMQRPNVRQACTK